MRGVSHPLPVRPARGRAARKAAAAADAGPWRGPVRRYDILKEGTIAAVITGVITLVMAGVLSSPDVPSLSIKTWATVDPVGFVNTAATELDGTSVSADYGPFYNNGTGSLQQVGPVSWQKLFGITQPVNSATLFVLDPLAVQARTSPALAAALASYETAPAAQQLKWATAYDKATAPGATKVPFNAGDLSLPSAGPVPVLMAGELAMARSGALDADLLAQRQFYGTDYTKPLLFIAVWAIYLTGICTILLLLVPFIPGLRDIPRYLPVYRLVWRNWYRTQGAAGTPTQQDPTPDAHAARATSADAAVEAGQPVSRASHGNRRDPHCVRLRYQR
jgi:hypothetical protein